MSFFTPEHCYPHSYLVSTVAILFISLLARTLLYVRTFYFQVFFLIKDWNFRTKQRRICSRNLLLTNVKRHFRTIIRKIHTAYFIILLWESYHEKNKNEKSHFLNVTFMFPFISSLCNRFLCSILHIQVVREEKCKILDKSYKSM
jgi:hypothetical protein